jgi:hypothetical protein
VISEDRLHADLEKAFDYRGDVTITRKDGSTLEGYLFDRKAGPSPAESYVRLYVKDQPGKITISFADIAAVALTGRDTAAGKSFEAWVKKYLEKKAAGEKNIGITAEPLDA